MGPHVLEENGFRFEMCNSSAFSCGPFIIVQLCSRLLGLSYKEQLIVLEDIQLKQHNTHRQSKTVRKHCVIRTRVYYSHSLRLLI